MMQSYVYDNDRQLAEAAAALGLSKQDQKYFDKLDKNNVEAMSGFLDYILGKHCPRPN